MEYAKYVKYAVLFSKKIHLLHSERINYKLNNRICAVSKEGLPGIGKWTLQQKPWFMLCAVCSLLCLLNIQVRVVFVFLIWVTVKPDSI